MTWTRLSDDWVGTLGDVSPEAALVHVCSLIECNRQLTDGYVSKKMLSVIAIEANMAAADDRPTGRRSGISHIETIAAELVARELVEPGWERLEAPTRPRRSANAGAGAQAARG